MAEKPPLAGSLRERRRPDLIDRPYQIILTSPVHPKVDEIMKPLSASQNIGVHTIAGENECLRLVEQIPVSLLLLSVATKDEVLGSLTLLKSLVRLNRVQNLRILAISRYDDPRLASTFLNAGCNEYLPQHIPRNSLMFKINLQLKALRARQMELERELALKLGIDFDPDALLTDFGADLSLNPINPPSPTDWMNEGVPGGPERSRSDWRLHPRTTPGISRFLGKRKGVDRNLAPFPAGHSAEGPPASNIQLFIELSDRLRQGRIHETAGWLIGSLQARLGASSVALIRMESDEPGTGVVVSSAGSGFRTGEKLPEREILGDEEAVMARALHAPDSAKKALLGYIVLRKAPGRPGLTDSQIAMLTRLDRPIAALLAKL